MADMNDEEKIAEEPDSARWKCNKCGKVVSRNLGWKLWTPSYCEQTGQMARLYRVSAPNTPIAKVPSGHPPEIDGGAPLVHPEVLRIIAAHNQASTK